MTNKPLIPAGEALAFHTLITPTEGGIASRVLARSAGGNVTLFAFDGDQELSEHTAPFDALVHILEGNAEIKISGRPFNLGTGDAIVMPADKPHALKALTPFKMLLTMIRN